MLGIKDSVITGAVGAVGVVAVIVVLSSCATVPAGHVGVQSLFGDVSERALQPGAHLVNPLSHVTKMNCQMLRNAGSHAAASKDMQDVKVELGLNFHLLPDHAVTVYKDIGEAWADVVIQNAESETLKAEIAHHNASDILQNRVAIKSAVEKSLSEWLKKYGLALDEVSISNISFSGDYEAAIEKKQVEEQTVLRKAYELQTAQKQAEIAKAVAAGEAQAIIEQAKGAAESVTIRAEAQAAANEKIAASLRDGGALVVAIAQVEKWDGKLPATLVGKDAASIFVGAAK